MKGQTARHRWTRDAGRALAFAAGFAATALAAAAGAPGAALEQDKTHVLFMGVDIAVAQGPELYRVRDVAGGSFVINVQGEPVFVPMSGTPIKIRVDQSLKLSRFAATLDQVRGERAYTPGNDPRVRNALEQARLTTALADTRAQAQVGVDETQQSVPTGVGTARGSPASRTFGSVTERFTVANEALTTMAGSDYFAKHVDEDLAQQCFDAMEVNFEVSSPVPLRNPYVLIITRYREAKARPGEVHNWIFAKSLPPISAQPGKVHVLQGGFPPGFVLENFQVHLYERGQEVATNAVPKRVPLTANEAMLYLMIDYLAAHKKETLPASPALTTLPADFQAQLAQSGGQQMLYVKVSREGRIVDAFLDAACTTKLDDPYLVAAMNGIRFKPALDRGKPVESVAQLKLTDLPLAL